MSSSAADERREFHECGARPGQTSDQRVAGPRRALCLQMDSSECGPRWTRPPYTGTHLLVINIHELLRSRRFFCAFLQHLIRAKTGPGVGFYNSDCFCAAARTIIEISDYDDELRCLSKQLFAQYLYTQTEAPSYVDIKSPRKYTNSDTQIKFQ